MGDVILATSLLKLLKQSYGPQIEITFLTAQEYEKIIESSPWVDKCWGIKREKGRQSLKKLIHGVRARHQREHFDLLLDLHGSLRTWITRLSIASLPAITVDKRTVERFFLTQGRLNILSSQYPAPSRKKGEGELLTLRLRRDFADLFALQDIKAQDYPHSFIGLPPAPKITEGANPYRWVAMIPSASFAEKRWSLDSFKELAHHLLREHQELGIVLLAGPGDSFCTPLRELTKHYPERFLYRQGDYSLAETPGILKQCVLCVGNDTGLPHMAEALGVPTVVVLGPTAEEFGYYPHLPYSSYVRTLKKLWCRPCTSHGRARCIRQEQFCLTKVTVEQVYQKVVATLEKIGKKP